MNISKKKKKNTLSSSSRFALNLVPDKETKAESFLDGLQSRSREKISFLEIKEYTKMVNMATIAEKGIKEAHADYIQKRSMP